MSTPQTHLLDNPECVRTGLARAWLGLSGDRQGDSFARRLLSDTRGGGYSSRVAKLDPSKRAHLPNSAFAYIDSRGKRRLPIHDESHVRNALSRFNQVRFEDDAAREQARKRLLTAAKRYGIVPIGFITGQIESERTDRKS